MSTETGKFKGSLPVIVLAGGNKNFRFSDLATAFSDLYHYHEHYLQFGQYKTIRPVYGTINGVDGNYPLVLFILKTLSEIEGIGPIKVVGPKNELTRVFNQSPFETAEFDLVDQGKSFGENVLHGYNSIGGKGHALLVMGDSPLTSARSINDFIRLSRGLLHYEFILPVVKAAVLRKLARFMPRPYLKLLPTGLEPEDYCLPADLDERGRVGFRLTSLALVNLKGTTASQINHLRSLRKLLRPSVQKMVQEDLGANILIQYRRGIPVEWLCRKVEQLYGKSMKIVGLPEADSAIDVDSSSDLRSINRIFYYRKKQKHSRLT